MIAADSSTWVAFLQGEEAEDTALLDHALKGKQLLIPPVVLAEVLSNPHLPKQLAEFLVELPLVEVEPGYWQRAGLLRAKILAGRRKARLGDALIAQSCIDRGIPLITRDDDFKAFAAVSPLELLLSR